MTPLLEQYFFNMYKMDYDFGWYDKNQMKDLVVQGFLSPENYQKIVGEDYVAPTAQPAQAQPTTQSAAPTQTTTTADEGNNK